MIIGGIDTRMCIFSIKKWCSVFLASILIFSVIGSVQVFAKPPKYISQFFILEQGEVLQCRFSLQDEDYKYTTADGIVNLKIYDSRGIIVYDDTHNIVKSDFGWYTLLLTGEGFQAHVWEVPISSIEKGTNPGSATLTFTSGDWIWKIDFDWVMIPEYTEEELVQLYEEKYLSSCIVIEKIINKSPFEITLLSVGEYTYIPYTWADEETYFRIDLKIRNIGSNKEYFFTSGIVIIDNLWNQYDSEYYGTLESGEIYPGVIKTGSVLFPELNKDAENIRIIITKSAYPEDIVYEFTLDTSEIIIREISTISCLVTPTSTTEGKSITVIGSLNPPISDATVILQ